MTDSDSARGTVTAPPVARATGGVTVGRHCQWPPTAAASAMALAATAACQCTGSASGPKPGPASAWHWQ